MAIEDLPRQLPRGSRLYLRPLGLVPAARADAWLACGQARLLAGGPFAMTACELLLRRPGGVERFVASPAEIVAWAEAVGAVRVGALLSLMAAPRALPAAGAPPLIMGIVNVTPDSFSDGGRFSDPAMALAQAERLAEEGAAIIDIGAESVRPGAEPVALEEERRRIAPVLEALAARRKGKRDALRSVALSIDTRKAAVMRQALSAGAAIINDVSALTYDPNSLVLAANSKASVVLMHGLPDAIGVAPENKVLGAEPALDLFDALEARIAACEAAGIGRERLIVDPGIGFGKSGAETLAIISQIGLLHGLGCPILLGVSRKGLTGALDRRHGPGERLPDSLAAALSAAGQGVQILRVHDVAATRQALDVWRGIVGAAA
ncbi:MAG: dihydropteroate synthase [Kiloniellales bacterium]